METLEISRLRALPVGSTLRARVTGWKRTYDVRILGHEANGNPIAEIVNAGVMTGQTLRSNEWTAAGE